MDKWTNQIDQTTKKFLETFSDLNSEQLNWKPDPGTWSIAQNIAHIILLNKSYFQKFEKIKLGTNNIAVATRLRHWFTFARNPITPYTDTNRIKRAKTYEFWGSTRTDYTNDIFTDFQMHQAEFKKYIDELKGINGKTLMHYPGNNAFIFTLESAFDLLVDHEIRHYHQAKELSDKMLLRTMN